MHLGFLLCRTLAAETYLRHETPYFCSPPFIEIFHIREGEGVLRDPLSDQPPSVREDQLTPSSKSPEP